MAAKYTALTGAAVQAAAQAGAGTRQASAAAAAARARQASARVACAASLLRWSYFMTVHDAAWDAAAASGAARQREAA
jgi:hypothetical protein